MNLRCLFGHDWGKQENIRERQLDATTILFFALPLTLFGMPKECDRKCLRCGKLQTFVYDRRR